MYRDKIINNAFKVEVISVGHGTVNDKSDDLEVYINSMFIGEIKGGNKELHDLFKEFIKDSSLSSGAGICSFPRYLFMNEVGFYPWEKSISAEVFIHPLSSNINAPAEGFVNKINEFVIKNMHIAYERNITGLSAEGKDLEFEKFKRKMRK